MTKPIPLTEFQSSLPDVLPRHLRRRMVLDEGCWIVSGAESHGRYQSVSIGNRSVLAHRFVYETLVGPIPEGLQIDHLCRVRWCANPAHLEAVTPRVNSLRSTSIAAQRAIQTRCVNGHDLSGANLYVRPDGRGRQCRECQRRNERRHAGRGE